MSSEERAYTEQHKISHFILLEQAANGDLFDYTLRINEPLGEDLARHYFLQLLDAIEYLHNSARIVHRDIKLENILLDENFNLKLCDFTLSKTFAEGNNVGIYYTNAGTERYMAPEIVEGKPYRGTSADIFSLGVTQGAIYPCGRSHALRHSGL